MGSSYNNLLQMIVGNFDFEKLSRANEWMAPIYFVCTAVIGYFVLRNLFVAIIADEFNRVAVDVRNNGFYWLRSSYDIRLEQERLQQRVAAKHNRRYNAGAQDADQKFTLLAQNRAS